MIPRISTKERKRRLEETIEIKKSVVIDVAPELFSMLVLIQRS